MTRTALVKQPARHPADGDAPEEPAPAKKAPVKKATAKKAATAKVKQPVEPKVKEAAADPADEVGEGPPLLRPVGKYAEGPLVRLSVDLEKDLRKALDVIAADRSLHRDRRVHGKNLAEEAVAALALAPEVVLPVIEAVLRGEHAS